MAGRIGLTLIRHLPTVGNQKKQYIGWTDEPIIEPTGVVHFLMGQPAVVYGSDLRRCEQSAAIYFPGIPYKADARLRESHFGEWEGKTYALLKDNKVYRAWIDNPTTQQPPGGESLAEVKKRVWDVLLDLPDNRTDYTIVTHGGPIRILLTAFAPEVQDFWSWTIPHGSAWHLEWASRSDFKEGKRCESISVVPTTESALM